VQGQSHRVSSPFGCPDWLDARASRTYRGEFRDLLGPRRSPVGGLKDYALARLGDPALSPEAVARACYVSVRQLHRLFAREGLTFGGWVREQQLRRCRDDLTDPRHAHLTVAEVAARWGFRSAAHFCRAFEARYGITPSGCRRGPC
jgi:AraC-like DNA-binding protein